VNGGFFRLCIIHLRCLSYHGLQVQPPLRSWDLVPTTYSLDIFISKHETCMLITLSRQRPGSQSHSILRLDDAKPRVPDEEISVEHRLTHSSFLFLPSPHSSPPSSRLFLNCPRYIMSQSLSPSLSHIHVLTRLIYLITLLFLLPPGPRGGLSRS
jgi:hypothetical protein